MTQEVLIIRRILVGTEGLPDDEAALAALCSTVNPERAQLRIVNVITVPMTAPLDAPMPDAEAHAARILQRAREIAGRFNIPVDTAVLRGRRVGECLAEDARRGRASAIFVRFRSRSAPMGHYLVSATVSVLLNTAPCPVLTMHFPHR